MIILAMVWQKVIIFHLSSSLEQGTPNETNTYESVDAAFDYLTKDKGFKPEDIIVYVILEFTNSISKQVWYFR